MAARIYSFFAVRCKAISRSRRGMIVTLLAVLLPALAAVACLSIDLGRLHTEARITKQACDAGAMAGAIELRSGNSAASARTVAEDYVKVRNNLSDATVQVNVPPLSGTHAGSSSYCEVIVTRDVPCAFLPIVAGVSAKTVTTRSVSGIENTSAGSAVMVLDPDPPPFQLGVVTPLLPPLPAILGGLEVLGIGAVQIDGAVIVNTQWGGVDENGDPAGFESGPPYAISCTPLVSLTKLKARDIEVVGGVDSRSNYGPFASGGSAPLACNRLPVPDPFSSLAVPTTSADATNVVNINRGGVTVVGLPLIGPPVTLQPGVYDYIEVVSGIATFQPGVYVIKGKNPITQLSLSVVAGQVNANGVMFYITNTGSYSVTSGTPDATDLETSPPYQDVSNLLPSTVINIGLLNSTWRGLNAPGSPFDGMLIYQRRHDRRPIVLVQENILGAGTFQGTVYSKWGHVILAGKGNYDARFVAGTMRIVALLDCKIAPTAKLPAAQDVFLVE